MKIIQNYEMICDDQELVNIQSKYNIEEERFVSGVIFSEHIIMGEKTTNAYSFAFDCELKEANTKASNFRNAKWIQEIIKYLKPDQETLYFGEIRQIIRKGMAIIDSNSSDDKDKIAAMNALAKYVKAPSKQNQGELTRMSESGKLIANLIQGIAELSSSDKMIGKGGIIIDVPILE